MAGATAVQVGAANFANPRAMETIAEEMAAWMDAHGVKTLEAVSYTHLQKLSPALRFHQNKRQWHLIYSSDKYAGLFVLRSVRGAVRVR